MEKDIQNKKGIIDEREVNKWNKEKKGNEEEYMRIKGNDGKVREESGIKEGEDIDEKKEEEKNEEGIESKSKKDGKKRKGKLREKEIEEKKKKIEGGR